MPKTVTGEAVRRKVLTVPACRECNSLINDSPVYSITERRSIAHKGIRRKYKKQLAVFDYSPEEISEFGHALRTAILAAKQNKEIILARLAWPEDTTYDMRYLGHSGIDDPYALGLITVNDE